MFLDSYNFIVMEQTTAPGNTGDSVHETSRYVTLLATIGDKTIIDLTPFITDKGVIRHPTSPWRENDASSDAVAPLIVAASITQPKLADKVIKQLDNNYFKTGNGDVISFGLIANIERHNNSPSLWVTDLAILGQALIFKLPFRWSDSKKGFEKSEGSSSDYLNYTNSLAFAKIKNNMTWPLKLAMKLINKDTILNKIKAYYSSEPNSQWLIDLYIKALGKIYNV